MIPIMKYVKAECTVLVENESSERILDAEEILIALEKLKETTVGRFEDVGNTLKPMVVWKYDGYMQATLYRITDIATDAIEMWRRLKLVSAVILARSLMETASATYWLAKRAERKIADGNLDGANEEVNDLSFASKITKELPQGKSVMAYIDEVEKLLPGYRDVYDIMSEASHPNHMGTLWAYSELDKESFEVTFFSKHPDAENFLEQNMPAALSGSLSIMQIALDEYNKIRPALVELGQQDLKKYIKED